MATEDKDKTPKAEAAQPAPAEKKEKKAKARVKKAKANAGETVEKKAKRKYTRRAPREPRKPRAHKVHEPKLLAARGKKLVTKYGDKKAVPVLVGQIKLDRGANVYKVDVFDAAHCNLAHQTGTCRTWDFSKDEMDEIKRYYCVYSFKKMKGIPMIGMVTTGSNTVEFKELVDY